VREYAFSHHARENEQVESGSDTGQCGVAHKRAVKEKGNASCCATRHRSSSIWRTIEILRKQAVLNFGSRPTAHWQMESDRRKNGNLANDCHGRTLL
jgi:hypothetical protein